MRSIHNGRVGPVTDIAESSPHCSALPLEKWMQLETSTPVCKQIIHFLFFLSEDWLLAGVLSDALPLPWL